MFVNLVREAFDEAVKKYKDSGDVEGALTFFIHAVSIYESRPTFSDIEWAESVIVTKRNRKD